MERNKLNVIAEWDEHMQSYRLYAEDYPQQTIAYEDDINDVVVTRLLAYGYDKVKVISVPEEKVDKKQFINMGIVFAIAVAAAAAVFGWLIEVGAI